MSSKLLLHPLLVVLLFMPLANIDPMLRNAAILMGCMPMFAGYPIIAQRYDLGTVCAPTLVVTTLVSFVTINAVIWLLPL